MTTKKRTYPAEFKQEAVRLWETTGKSAMAIERELGKYEHSEQLLRPLIETLRARGRRGQKQAGREPVVQVLRPQGRGQDLRLDAAERLRKAADMTDAISREFEAAADLVREGQQRG